MIIELQGRVASPLATGGHGRSCPLWSHGCRDLARQDLRVRVFAEAGSGMLGLNKGGSGGRDSMRWDLGCRDPTGQDLGDSGTQHGRFGDRHPMKQLENRRSLPTGPRFGLSGVVSDAAALPALGTVGSAEQHVRRSSTAPG